MCMKCWQGLPWASSPPKKYLSYMRLYSVQQFIVFTENVEKASLFLSEFCLHKLSNTNVVILYKILRYSRDLGTAGYLPTARESYDGLRLQSEKARSRKAHPDVMAPHSKVPSNCRPFRTCVPNCRRMRRARSCQSLRGI